MIEVLALYIIIFMDDMGYGNPDFNMGVRYTTPNLDRRAAEGMEFANLYSVEVT